jgi:hypothetical protein
VPPRRNRRCAPTLNSPPPAPGYAVAACLGVRERELAAVNDALRSGERYFRLRISEARGARGGGVPGDAAIDAAAAAPAAGALAADEGSPAAGPAAEATAGGGSSEHRGRSAAAAFRLVAGAWLLSRYEVGRLGFVLTSMHIVYLYITWLSTYDLTTPAVAAGLHAAFEAWLSSREHAAAAAAQEARVAARAAAAGWPERPRRGGRGGGP